MESYIQILCSSYIYVVCDVDVAYPCLELAVYTIQHAVSTCTRIDSKSYPAGSAHMDRDFHKGIKSITSTV